MKEKIKKILNYLLVGTLAVIPLAIVVKILLFVKVLIADLVRFVYGYSDNAFYTSIFFALSFVVLVFIGHKLVIEGRVWFLALIDAIIEKIPFLNTIYRVLKKVINMFSTHEKTVSKEVVYVEYPKEGLWVPAYVTNRYNDKYVLFVPTSPNPTSGFTVIVDKNKVVKSSMNIEEASSFIVSIGVDYDKLKEMEQLP